MHWIYVSAFPLETFCSKTLPSSDSRASFFIKCHQNYVSSGVEISGGGQCGNYLPHISKNPFRFENKRFGKLFYFNATIA